VCCSLQATDNLDTFLVGVGDGLVETARHEVQTGEDTTSDDPDKQSAHVQEILVGIQNANCPGKPSACSIRGKCVEGRCHCDTGNDNNNNNNNKTLVMLLPAYIGGRCFWRFTAECQSYTPSAAQLTISHPFCFWPIHCSVSRGCPTR